MDVCVCGGGGGVGGGGALDQFIIVFMWEHGCI